MKQYQVKTNLVSIKYKIGDIISAQDLMNETNIAYHLSKGNIEEIHTNTNETRGRKNRNEEITGTD